MKYLFMILLAGALAGCAGLEKLPPAPTVAEIVEMSKSGMNEDEIIKRIHASRAVYQVPASELAKMRAQGVPDKVIDYMHQSYIEAVRYAEWLRARDAYLFPPFGTSPFRPYFWPGPYGW